MEKSNKSPNSVRKTAIAFNTTTECLYRVAEMSIVYNQIIKPADRPKVTQAHEAAAVLRPLIGADMEVREAFYILYLNRLNSVVAAYKVGLGGVAACAIDMKLIMYGAISNLACGMILCHNHPSGNLNPSDADIDLTRKIKAGAKLLDVMVLDHIILTSEGHYSLANEGLM